MKPSIFARVCLALSAVAAFSTMAQFVPLTPAERYALTGWKPVAGGGYAATGDVAARYGAVRALTSGAGGSVVAATTQTLVGPAGELAVTAATRMSAAAIARAAAQCLSMSTPVCFVAGATAMAYSYYRVKSPSVVPGSQVPVGSVDYDPGVAPVSMSGYTSSSSNPVWSGAFGSTPKMAAANGVAQSPSRVIHGGGQTTTESYVLGTCAPDSPTYAVCQVMMTSTCFPDAGYTSCSATTSPLSVGTIDTVGGTSSGCPASIDPLNSLYNVPAGQAVGSDGKCPSARYFHVGLSPDELAAKGFSLSNPAAVAGEILGKSGAEIQATPEAVTGPASQQGAPQTTSQQNPDGTTITTTKTPTHTFNYGSDSFTWNTSYSTTINNAGNVTTINESVPAPQALDPKDPCTANPGRLGCMSLDTPASTQALPRTNVPISFLPAVFQSAGGCPADIPYSISVSGFSRSFALSFAPLCDWASGISGLFLALASITATVIFMEALRPV